MRAPTFWLGVNDLGPTLNIWPAPDGLHGFHQFDWSFEGLLKQTIIVEAARHRFGAKVIELAGVDPE